MKTMDFSALNKYLYNARTSLIVWKHVIYKFFLKCKSDSKDIIRKQSYRPIIIINNRNKRIIISRELYIKVVGVFVIMSVLYQTMLNTDQFLPYTTTASNTTMCYPGKSIFSCYVRTCHVSSHVS